MSQTQTTQGTSQPTSESSLKTKTKQKTTIKAAEDNANGIDLESLKKGESFGSFDAAEARISAAEMFDFEQNIAYLQRRASQEAHKTGRPVETVWFEVSKEFLSGLNGGELPKTNYVIWNNARICLHGTAESIAKEESKTIHEVVFKSEDKYKLVTVLKK